LTDTVIKQPSCSLSGFFSRDTNRLEIIVEKPLAAEAAVVDREEWRDEAAEEAALEGLCPWLLRNPTTNAVEYNEKLYASLSGKVLGHLSNFPGANLSSIHATLPILTKTQTTLLLQNMQRQCLIQSQDVPCIAKGAPTPTQTCFFARYF